MKKGLTILTACLAVPTLFSCKYTFAKITGIKIQAINYALNNKPYKVSAIVEGEGAFSSEVTWTTDNPNASVDKENRFRYVSAGSSTSAEVTITATSVKDKTKSASAKINVIAAQELTQAEFKNLAETGDNTRKELKYTTVEAEPGNDDKAIFKDAGPEPVSVDYAKYDLPSEGLQYVRLKHNGISKFKNCQIHTAEQLDKAFSDPERYKDWSIWFRFNDKVHGECYGYCVDKPATSSEKSKYLYSVFQNKTGLPVYYTYYEDDKLDAYLNLTPKFA